MLFELLYRDFETVKMNFKFQTATFSLILAFLLETCFTHTVMQHLIISQH